MKYFRITFILCCIIVLSATQTACINCGDYLRVHIRANSNESTDQAIKYNVRDEVVKYLTPIVSPCNNKERAIAAIVNNESAVKELIDEFLAKNGFDYKCRVSVRKENFPTRVYEGVTLQAGLYDALIIELGEGKGANWWCVVYPPLCFTGREKIKYRSKIYDILNN